MSVPCTARPSLTGFEALTMAPVAVPLSSSWQSARCSSTARRRRRHTPREWCTVPRP